jgi:hypothetical protein
MTFSDRMGFTAPSQLIQVDSMSEELRNSLWNLLTDVYDSDSSEYWTEGLDSNGAYSDHAWLNRDPL